MKYKIYYTRQAELDIKDIYEYIAYTLFAPKAAKRMAGEIMKAVSALDSQPESFPLYRKEPWKAKGLRFFSVGK